jgi:hypothetical protein
MKYRIKQVENKYYPQQRPMFFPFWLEYYEYVPMLGDRPIFKHSIEAAKQVIEDSIADKKAKTPIFHKVKL